MFFYKMPLCPTSANPYGALEIQSLWAYRVFVLLSLFRVCRVTLSLKQKAGISLEELASGRPAFLSSKDWLSVPWMETATPFSKPVVFFFG